MAAQSYYCPKCQVLVDESEVDSEELQADDQRITEVHYHTLMVALTVAGEEKAITHRVIVEP
jgi:hypothetical protein